ncbi:hypothetical protein [Actinomadura sp. WMMB 499]|uniref:hypothetical protein n=1 Tax=Actinomadura sp. WMMB 499 TaxID=1219491 RepID=UPI0012487AF7|nr:hypothetical protein [Actinomadura sp. WMMB 499]QFG23920.1 hypothetical protein F7P10_25160 [Actinomadura sp. WMMB 499]
MSGPEDTRETGEEADSSAAAPSAPPSFGGATPPAGATADAPAVPPADGAEAPAPTAPRLPPFGLEAPWWASDSTEAAPEPVTDDATREATRERAPEGGGPRSAASPPPGTLVAGVGIPRVDSRGAVPAEPLVPPAPSTFTETDPDGIPAVRPDAVPPPRAGAEPAAAPVPEPAQAVVAAPNGAPAAPVREAAPEPVPPAEPAPSAFERAREAEKVSASAAPVLVPDAILPRGVLPPSGESGPHPRSDGGEEPPVGTPGHHEQGAPATDPPPPPGGTDGAGGKAAKGPGKRRTLLIGGGAAVVLAAVIALFAVGGTGSSDDGATREAAERPVQTPTSPAPAQGGQAPPPPAPDPSPLKIDGERTDPKPLEFTEVFPTPTITLGGHAYRLDRRSINRDLKYAANGAMLQALQRQQCRKIVRATYLDPERSIAVTSGIAVMPTKDAAVTVSRAGDPARYQWFRGMPGEHTAGMDRAGGYAATTVRGRYVVYAYVQRTDGRPVQPGDQAAKQAAQQFIDHNIRPLDTRARG